MEQKEILELLKKVAISEKEYRKIGAELTKHIPSNNPEHPLWKFIFAFEYMYVEETHQDYYERYGSFAPWIEMENGIFPPPLDTLEDAIFFEWEELLEHTNDPSISSRIADLLWVKKWGKRPDLFAKTAIDSYFQIQEYDFFEIEKTKYLGRALKLAKLMNDKEKIGKTIELIVDQFNNDIYSDNPKPGISTRLIQYLMDFPKGEIPEIVDELLEIALRIYKDKAWIAESIMDLMIKRVGKEDQEKLKISQINLWIEESEKNDRGLIVHHNLQHALELARIYGFQSLANEIRQKIQSIPEESFGLQTISSEVKIPSKIIDNFINSFVVEMGWRESLMKFGFYGPPSGKFEKNIEEVEESFKKFPVQFLVTRVVFDENNTPLKYGSNIDENKEIEKVNTESRGIRIFGTLAPTILEKIFTKHVFPSIEELAEFFTTPLIPKELAETLAKGIYWYKQGEYDISSHLLVPRIEAIFRNLARELGLVIIREPCNGKPGGVIQLGKILSDMDGRIDKSWQRYFYNLLSDPIGINLRNRICHGLIPSDGVEDASLLIHLICHLRLLRISTQIQDMIPD